ncbi:DUF1269 domain-containing protein [Conyzicola sp.]|uniref:DUF1269 domain-containing protein n=1 Tax=Conyzicola sp. TaxID=1969404 RepID=UPI003988C51B
MNNTLTVWKFDEAEKAEEAAQILVDLQKEKFIELEDVAAVSWPTAAEKPSTRQYNSTVSAGGAVGGALGLFLGFLFVAPIAGAALGASAGALVGSLRNVGIDDHVIARIRAEVVPGTSAVFVLSTHAVVDRVANAFEGFGGDLIETNLSRDDEANLRAEFDT